MRLTLILRNKTFNGIACAAQNPENSRLNVYSQFSSRFVAARRDFPKISRHASCAAHADVSSFLLVPFVRQAVREQSYWQATM
jgi:hypothetical protein